MSVTNTPEKPTERETPGGRRERLAEWLVGPAHTVAGVETRRQARLLSGFLFVLAALTLMGTVMPAMFGMTPPLQDPFVLMMGATFLLLAIAYGFSRTARFQIGALLTLFTLSALPFALSIARNDFSPERLPSVFGWLILPVLFGSIFLPVKGILALTAVQIAGLVAFPMVFPQVPDGVIFPPISLLGVVASLLAVAVYSRNSLEQVRLAALSEKNEELEAMRASLEASVQSRTADLERRVTQIRTAAEIAQNVSAMLDPVALLQRVVDLVGQRFDLYYVGVFLLEEGSGYAVLQAGTGEAGKKMVAEGHRLAVGGTSMVGWATAHREARIALDVGREAVHFNNPHLPLTRSELALPLVTGDQVLGALTVQSTQPEAFDEDDIAVLQGIADSLATAIRNARLFQQVQENLSEIETLHRSYLTQAWTGESLPEHVQSFSLERAADGEPDGHAASISMPLALREQVIGHLTLEADKPHWSPEEKAFIEAVTSQAAVALENARLLEETRRRADRERVLTEVSGKIWASTDLDTILQTAIQEIGRVMNAAEGTIEIRIED